MPNKTPKKILRKKKSPQANFTPRIRPVRAVAYLTSGVLSFAAIASFDLQQSAQWTTDAQPGDNLVGVVGAVFGFNYFAALGVAAWLLPVFAIWLGLRNFTVQKPRKPALVFTWFVLASCSAAGLFELLSVAEIVQPQESFFSHQLSHGLGGIAGFHLASTVLHPYMGTFGSVILLAMGFVIGSMLSLTDNFGSWLQFARKSISTFSTSFTNWRSQRALKAEERKALKAERSQQKADAKAQKIAEAKALAEAQAQATATKVPESRPSLLNPPDASAVKGTVKNAPSPKTTPKATVPAAETQPEVATPAPVAKPKFNPESIKIVKREKTEKAVASIPEQRGDHKFPLISLLNEAPDANLAGEDDHAETMTALVQTLEEFGVKVIPGEIHTGPVITRYEITPAAGVRVEKIVNLDKNIALGLKAESVRILAPVPGKGTVGIEVPNHHAQPVCMRDIVESKAWAEAKAEIPIVLGKDVTGIPMVADLTKMPHVLIAGSTGSGKTVCINAIIASLLYHASPEDLRFIMVDPKVVEMQVYNALPHMLIPVVTEPKKVPGALKWLIAEMERRYQIFAKENVRNIAGFNAKLVKTKEEKEKAAAMDAEMTADERAAISQIEVPRDDDAFEIPRKKLPYIVCIIDELADLMMVAPADIETGIARLAQLARAAGIHLILATQRPSVNVITGVIKANLPSRISFKVASKVDSRTILDGGGAEALIGKGDMLFIPPGTSTLVRAQGAFVSDDEINGIVDYLKANNEPPNFAQEVQNQINSSAEEGSSSGGSGSEPGSEDDELLGKAIDVLRSTKRASTSMLQRRLRIGYNRAARLMEELEDRGIVGPENGSSPREILVDLDVM